MVNLQSAPKSSAAFIWADYVELLCLITAGRQFSKSELVALRRSRREFGEGIEPPENDNEEVDESETIVSLNEASSKDQDTLFVDDVFRHLQQRSGSLENRYPFMLEANDEMLTLRHSLTLNQKLYIFLLIASNLRYFSGNIHELTRSFELISHLALTIALPPPLQVHLFGAHHTGKFTGSLWKKLQTLAKEINETVRIKQREISRFNTGDRGLDLVAWLTFGDTNEGVVLIFGQCACSEEEWTSKQHSSGADSWRAIFMLKAAPINVVMIPHHFRHSDGDWYVSSDIHGSVLLDRSRLMYLLGGASRRFKNLLPTKFINEILYGEQTQA